MPASGSLWSGPLMPVLMAVILFAYRVWTDRTERGRDQARRRYMEGRYPYFLRMAPATSPLMGLALLVVAAALVAPTGLKGIVGSVGMGLVAAAAAAGYRRPPLLAARWMLEEIRTGRLPEALPDAIDRLMFRLFAALAILMPLGGIVLTAAGQSR
jgi:hypothetical protein